MKNARVVPIVEGHGEVIAVRTLLDRTWREVIGGEWIDVLTPIRRPRTKLLKPDRPGGPRRPDSAEIARAIRFATVKLAEKAEPRAEELILMLLDADEDCPKELAPELLNAAHAALSRYRVEVVLAKREYETWFVATAESLTRHLHHLDELPAEPEQERCGKAWISKRFRRVSYSETIDQVRLTADMDLHCCRRRSPSFDKLCRVLEELKGDPGPRVEATGS